MTTVKELIEKLKEYPEDTVVSVEGYEGGITDTFSTKLVPVKINANKTLDIDGFYDKNSSVGEHGIKDDPDSGTDYAVENRFFIYKPD